MFYILHMCAAPSDLTAAATIREAAMELFAERGAAAVTIREVASASGVSPSLVIHHFGSKEGLKAAADARATALLEVLVSELMDASHPGGSATSLAGVFGERLEREPKLPAYIRRMLIDGGRPAESMFATLLDSTVAGLAVLERAQLLRPAADARLRAAFLLVNDLAAVMLREQLIAVAGVDPLAPAGLERWTREVLDVYTNGVFVAPPAAEAEGSPGAPS